MDKAQRWKVCARLVDRRMGCTLGGAIHGTGVSEDEARGLLEELIQEGIMTKQVAPGRATWYELTARGYRMLIDHNVALAAELYHQALE